MTSDATISEREFLGQLLERGLYVDLALPGLYALSAPFELVVSQLVRLISELEPSPVEHLRMPPLMDRSILEDSGYLSAFPHLSAAVRCFAGDASFPDLLDDLRDQEDWGAKFVAADLTLPPAACYPVYPLMARRGVLQEDGHLVGVTCQCYRHEPSAEPTRLRSFRQQEYVCLGGADAVISFREGWVERSIRFMKELGLEPAAKEANDPFFPRVGSLLEDHRNRRSLKQEIVLPIANSEIPCISINYHENRFAKTWNLHTRSGVAHTACVGFGLERLALAMFSAHGFDVDGWPRDILTRLKLF